MVSMLMSMLQATSAPTVRRGRGQYDKAKRTATLKLKRLAKWSGIFVEHGGQAGTNALASRLGRSNPSILKSMHELETEGVVRRVGTILKPGPGKSQIIWEWINNAD